MRQNKVVGLDNVTWKCNWNCKHCYFREFPQLHTNIDTSLEKLKQRIDIGKARGCTVVVLYGKGEPTMHNQISDIIDYISKMGMDSTIITNGTASIKKYEKLYDLGLNHLQISVHGLGEIIDVIAERKGAGKRQMELLQWLCENDYLFRINITLQLLNYREVLGIVKKVVQLGAFHVSLLNFLPHYKSTTSIKAVAVNPIDLIDVLENSMEYMEGKILFTLRYFPMCLLKPKYWKYVTNARFVVFDPWEYDSGDRFEDIEKVWIFAVKMGEEVGIKEQPCNSCLLRDHCGGWNRFYARIFNFEGLKAIKKVPNELKEVVNIRGGLFDLNPANSSEGYVN